MYEIRSHLATPAGYIVPSVNEFPSIESAKIFAFDNWSIAKWVDTVSGKNRYFARTANGVKEFVWHEWDAGAGVLTFKIAG